MFKFNLIFIQITFGGLKFKKKYFAVLLLFTVLACSKTEEPGIKPDVPQFFVVYQTFIELVQNDSTGMVEKEILMDSALALHGMEPAQFDTTLSYLERNPELFIEAFQMFDDSLRMQLQIRTID